MGSEGGGIGREGDWECNGCRNRNYAFRSFCNRCKKPRILVDTKTPADSKWMPRIGDWICNGCSNNNYASREKCKKCGQTKEVAAMPIHVPTQPNYFSSAQSLNSNWLNGINYGIQSIDPYRLHSASNWPIGTNQLPPVQNEWRNGDWICTCGFHNYSSRVQCKKCNAPTPIATLSPHIHAAVTAVGTKRPASEEFGHDWDNKRLNAGQGHGPFIGSSGSIYYPAIHSGIPAGTQNFNFQGMPVTATPILLGKGAKQWRDGDWMCSNCNNHNYASRAQCNRCKSDRDAVAQPVSVS